MKINIINTLALDRELHYGVEITFRMYKTQFRTDNAYCCTIKS